MILDKKYKQPADVKDYPIDYTDWLAENSPADTLASATSSVVCETDATDTALTVSNLVVSPQKVSPWLSGGTNGQRYKVTITVTTAAARIDQAEFKVIVKDT